MDSDGLILWLFAMTLLVAAQLATWQWTRARQVRRAGVHSVARARQARPYPRA